MRSVPKHAELPLWHDKNLEQKRETLRDLASDLSVYASLKNFLLPEIIIPEMAGTYEDIKEDVYNAYAQVLREDIDHLLMQMSQAVPHDEDEEKSIKGIDELIRSNPNVLNMNCEAGHITGSGLLVHLDTRRVLLHRHKKLGIWLQFGGHSDYELRAVDIARREVSEESGLSEIRLISNYEDASIPIDIDLQTIRESGVKPEHFHADLRFLFATESPDCVTANIGESDDFWWLTVEEAQDQPLDKITPQVQRLISKAKFYMDHGPYKTASLEI